MAYYNKTQWRASVNNGDIPRDLLAEVYPQQYDIDLQGPAIAHPDAALAMSDFLAEAKAQGIHIWVKYSYRTLSKQWEKWIDYQNGGNLAAYPGTSNHGWAVAFDLSWSQDSDIAWAHHNAERFGFKFDIPSESWHITYQGGYAEEVDMNLDEYEEGWDAQLAGIAFKDFWTKHKKRGFNAAKVATSRPKAEEHFHVGLAQHPHVHGQDTPVA